MMDDFRAMPDDEAIATAMSSVLTLFDFGVQNLKPLQMLSLRLLVGRRDVYACFPTGFGKSLIFHLLPHVCARLAANGFRQYPADPVVLVVTSLKSLMRDQVAILKRKGFAAAFVGESDSSDAAIRVGKFPDIYGSPEVLVGSREWRCALQANELRERFLAVVVDEAHTVV